MICLRFILKEYSSKIKSCADFFHVTRVSFAVDSEIKNLHEESESCMRVIVFSFIGVYTLPT